MIMIFIDIDLLRKRQKVLVCEDASGNSHLLHLTERIATSSSEFLDMLQSAQAQRATEETAVNGVSSRSHSLCKIQIRQHIRQPRRHAQNLSSGTSNAHVQEKEYENNQESSAATATTTAVVLGQITLLDLAGR